MPRHFILAALSLAGLLAVSQSAPLQQIQSNKAIGFSSKTPVDFVVNFFGRRYNRFWIEWKSGIVSFDESATYDTDEVRSFPNQNFKPNAQTTAHMDTPLIAVYYANAKKFHGANITVVTPQSQIAGAANVSQWCRDLVHANLPSSESFQCDNFVMITWIGSGPGGTFAASSLPRNYYQLLLSTSGEDTVAIFNYQDLKWHADQNNGGNDKGIIEDSSSANFPKVGFNMGEGRRFMSLPYSGRSEVITLSEGEASTIPPSWLPEKDAEDQSAKQTVRGIYVYKISQRAEVLVGSCHLGSLSASASDQHRRLSISPSNGYFLGGQLVTIRGQCFDANTVYDIRFETEPEITVPCKYHDKLSIHCVLTDWFMRRGYIPFRLFENKMSTKFTGNFYATIVGAGVMMQNYADMAGSLEVDKIPISWEPRFFTGSTSDHLTVSLYGYREIEDPETEEERLRPRNLIQLWSEKTPAFDFLRNVGNVSSVQASTFVIETASVRCKTGPDCKRMDSGVIAVEDPTSGRRIWSRPFQLGWLYTRLEEEPRTVAEICMMRYSKEKSRQEEDWREAVPNCPCSQKQAEADFRFSREDQFLGFGDATRCYVSYPIRGSTGASQCCYRVDNAGLLVYSNDSAKPNVIDSPMLRAHYLGGFPFNQYGRVPIFSHLSTDAILKHTCCAWSQKTSPTSCSYYKEVRATKDCSTYRTPHLASAYGLGHFKTFRGTFYQFYGKGEYFLMKGDRDDLVIQGRFEQVTNVNTGEPAAATGLTAIGAKVGCKYGSSKVYVQHNKNDPPGLYVYIDGVKQEHLDIRFKDRQVAKNVIESPCISVVTEMTDHSESVMLLLADGAVVKIKAVQQVLNIDVQMPDNSKKYPSMPAYTGLFGELSEFQRAPGADLYDLDGNRIIEPSEIQSPRRIENLAQKMLVRDTYQSVMLWFTEGLIPLDYYDPQFRADYRQHREAAGEQPHYQVVTEGAASTTVAPEQPQPIPVNNKAAPVEVPATTHHHHEETTAAKVEATETTVAPKVDATQPPALSAAPVNVLKKMRRRRREVFHPDYLETVEAYDFRLTGDGRLQAATKAADTLSHDFQRELVDKQEAFCPFLNIPNAVKSTPLTKVGTEVKIIGCNEGFKSTSIKSTTYKCEPVEGAKVATAHWVPEPHHHCTMLTSTGELTQEGLSVVVIILIAVGCALLVAGIIVAVCIVKNKSAQNTKTGAADPGAKYGVESVGTEESSPLNEVKVVGGGASSRPESRGPMSPLPRTDEMDGGEAYKSPVTLQPPTAFPIASQPQSPAPVVRQEDEV